MSHRKWVALVAVHAVGALTAFGCVTDGQLRDFASSTLIRTFWTAISELIRASVLGSQTA